MVKTSNIIMAGVTFTGGLLLGLILHLPGASSPHSRHIRSVTSSQQVSPTYKHPLEPLDGAGMGGVRSLLSKTAVNSSIRIIAPLRRNSLRHDHKTDSRRHSRRNNFNHGAHKEWNVTLDTSLTLKSGERSSSKPLLQANNKHGDKAIHSRQPISTEKPHNKQHINISLLPGNQRVLYRGKEHGGVRPRAKEIQHKRNEKEIESRKTETDDIDDESQNTPQVEMSVSVIDVATGSKDFKNPSDIINNDENLVGHSGTSGRIIKSSTSGPFTQLSQIVDGIYWTSQLERLTPKGFSETETSKWRQHASNSEVTSLVGGCGRMQNRLVVFQDGSKMCARYRINTDQIQGEVYSYYLAKTLGIDNVLPPILSKANPASPQWKSVSGAVDSAQWNPQKVFVLTPWLDNLQSAYIPREFRGDSTVTSHAVLSSQSQCLVNKTLDELTELVQWSDLIILDYLTANVDRVVNNMFNLQWNAGMMKAPTHNLERVGQSGPLVFLDNESGLLHSYRLLDKYERYHERLLRSLCVFRKSTANLIKTLYHSADVARILQANFRSNEPLAGSFAFIPQQNLSILSQRLGHVYRQIISCERTHSTS